MEAAGFAIGIVALASVFKDCIDLFGCISASRSVFPDAAILNSKLEIEKALLLDWCYRVGLVSRSHDIRLDRDTVRQAVHRAVGSIKTLLSDSNELIKGYGLQQDDNPEIMVDAGSAPTRNRLEDFIANFNDLQLRIGPKESRVSASKRIRWVVKDKEKFEALVTTLSYFVAKLGELLPAHPHIGRAKMGKDAHILYSRSTFLTMLRASNSHESETYKTVDRDFQAFCQNRILDCLWFRTMDDRREDISQPEFESFKWALEPPEIGRAKWDDLSAWLRSGSNIYWICGRRVQASPR